MPPLSPASTPSPSYALIDRTEQPWGYVGELSRDQMLLLPTSADDYASADSPARFIAAFVDDLDLGLCKLGFNARDPIRQARRL